MAREALLDRIEPGAVHRIRGELGYQDAADDYERELRAAFGDELPAIDLLLGLGPMPTPRSARGGRGDPRWPRLEGDAHPPGR